MQAFECILYITRGIVVHHVYTNFSARLFIRNVAGTASLFDFSKWGTRKANRKVKISLMSDMMDPKVEEALTPLRLNVKEQVRVPYGKQSENCSIRVS